LSGQTSEAFYISVMHAKPMCIGLNCALGPDTMYPFLERISNIADTYVHCYPNAGLPNPITGYEESMESFCNKTVIFAKDGLVNAIGGCCGTTPEFIKLLVQLSAGYKPRVVKPSSKMTLLSGKKISYFIYNN